MVNMACLWQECNKIIIYHYLNLTCVSALKLPSSPNMGYDITFIEQQFDDESFQMLTEEDIRQLVPKMGLRLKFVRCYRAQVSILYWIHLCILRKH